jgi:hypothetical protein
MYRKRYADLLGENSAELLYKINMILPSTRRNITPYPGSAGEGAGGLVPKELDYVGGKHAFGGVEEEPVSAEQLENLAQVMAVLLLVPAGDEHFVPSRRRRRAAPQRWRPSFLGMSFPHFRDRMAF